MLDADEDEWFHGQAYSSSTGGGGGGGQRFKMHALPNSSTSSIDVKDLTGMIRFFDAQGTKKRLRLTLRRRRRGEWGNCGFLLSSLTRSYSHFIFRSA